MTDNTVPPVPPIPPVPGASAPEQATTPPLPPVPTAVTPGEYAQPGVAPSVDPYAPPAAYGTPADQNPYAQQPPQQQPYGQQPYGQPAPYGAYAAAAPAKGMSIASLVCGIAGILTIGILTPVGFLAGLAAVILGFISKKSQPYAKGFWLTGIITGFVTLGLGVISVIALIAWFALSSASYDSF